MSQKFTVFAATVVAALAATPIVINAANALSTTDRSVAAAIPAAIVPVEIASVQAPTTETCARKVRVVYAAYGTPASACAAPAR